MLARDLFAPLPPWKPHTWVQQSQTALRVLVLFSLQKPLKINLQLFKNPFGEDSLLCRCEGGPLCRQLSQVCIQWTYKKRDGSLSCLLVWQAGLMGTGETGTCFSFYLPVAGVTQGCVWLTAGWHWHCWTWGTCWQLLTAATPCCQNLALLCSS